MIMNLLAAKTMSHPTRVWVDDVTTRPETATDAMKMMGVLLGRKSLTPPQGIATTPVK